MNIPQDPFILLSFINTKLRDEFTNIDDLCKSLEIERSQIEKTLSTIEYSYSKDQNRFTVML